MPNHLDLAKLEQMIADRRAISAQMDIELKELETIRKYLTDDDAPSPKVQSTPSAKAPKKEMLPDLCLKALRANDSHWFTSGQIADLLLSFGWRDGPKKALASKITTAMKKYRVNRPVRLYMKQHKNKFLFCWSAGTMMDDAIV